MSLQCSIYLAYSQRAQNCAMYVGSGYLRLIQAALTTAFTGHKNGGKPSNNDYISLSKQVPSLQGYVQSRTNLVS